MAMFTCDECRAPLGDCECRFKPQTVSAVYRPPRGGSATAPPKPTPTKTVYEYLVLEATTSANLEAKVVNYLSEGWTLAGGVSTDGYEFYQAVTRKSTVSVEDVS